MYIFYHSRLSINGIITGFNKFLFLHLLKVKCKDIEETRISYVFNKVWRGKKEC